MHSTWKENLPSVPPLTATTCEASTCACRGKGRCGSGSTALTWLEVKRSRKGVTAKKRRVLSLPEAARLERHALVAVDYDRTAFELPGCRVTLDRRVTASNGRRLDRRFAELDAVAEAVVVEVKGECPKFLKHLLPKAAKFSKARWALGE